MDEAFDSLDKEIRIRVDKNFDQRISQAVARDLDQKVANHVNQDLSKQVDRKVETKLGAEIPQLYQRVDKRVQDGIDQRVEKLVEEKMDDRIDSIHECLWRKKNVLIVNVPESTKRTIFEKRQDDLKVAKDLIAKIAHVEDNQIEGLPVRVGKIGPTPRMIRVSLASEYLVNTIVHNARENSDIINPYEKDNKKKIYFNRDYSENDRNKRKRLFAELKELKQKGDPNWVVTRTKLKRIDPSRKRINYNHTSEQKRQDGYDREMNDSYDRSHDRQYSQDRQRLDNMFDRNSQDNQPKDGRNDERQYSYDRGQFYDRKDRGQDRYDRRQDSQDRRQSSRDRDSRRQDMYDSQFPPPGHNYGNNDRQRTRQSYNGKSAQQIYRDDRRFSSQNDRTVGYRADRYESEEKGRSPMVRYQSNQMDIDERGAVGGAPYDHQMSRNLQGQANFSQREHDQSFGIFD